MAKAPSGSEDSDRKTRQLTKQSIIDAGLRVAKKKGFQRLTMRLLAEELAVTAMATYYYVPNKQALLELVADEIVGRAKLPPPEFGTWEDRLREWAKRNAKEVAAYPGLNVFLFEHQIPRSRQTHDEAIELLRDAGFNAKEAVLALATFETYMFGRVGVVSRRSSVRSRRGRADSAPPLHANDYLDFGLDTLFAGLNAQLARQR